METVWAVWGMGQNGSSGWPAAPSQLCFGQAAAHGSDDSTWKKALSKHWSRGSTNSQDMRASWLWREKVSQTRGNKGCFPGKLLMWQAGLRSLWGGKAHLQLMGWRKGGGRSLTNIILFCTEQIASIEILFAMITRLYHTLAVGMNGYVYAKMLSIF